MNHISKYAVSAVVCLVAVLALSVGISVNGYASWLDKQTLVTIAAHPTDTIYSNDIQPSNLFSSRFYLVYTIMSAYAPDPQGVRTQAFFITSSDSGATWSSPTLIYDHVTNGLGYIQCMRKRGFDGKYSPGGSEATISLSNTVGNNTTEYVHVLIGVSSQGPNCNFFGSLDQQELTGAVYVRITNNNGAFSYSAPTAIATPIMPTGVTFRGYCFFQCGGARLARQSNESPTAMIVSPWDGTLSNGVPKTGFFFLYSQDNGATWSTPTLIKDGSGSTQWQEAAEITAAIASDNNVCMVAAGLTAGNTDNGFDLLALGGTFTDITGNMSVFQATSPTANYQYDEPMLVNGRNSGQWIVAYTKISNDISTPVLVNEAAYFKRNSGTICTSGWGAQVTLDSTTNTAGVFNRTSTEQPLNTSNIYFNWDKQPSVSQSGPVDARYRRLDGFGVLGTVQILNNDSLYFGTDSGHSIAGNGSIVINSYTQLDLAGVNMAVVIRRSNSGGSGTVTPQMARLIAIVDQIFQKSVKSVSIYDLHGKAIALDQTSEAMAKLQDRLANGVYLAVKKDMEGKTSVVKIVIKR